MSTIAIDQARTLFPTYSPAKMVPTQRTGTTTARALTGTWSGTTPTNLEASFQGGSYAMCTAFTLNPLGAGTWSATLPGYVSDSGSLILRFTNETATSTTVLLVIGDVIVYFGDSTVVHGPGVNLGLGWGTPMVFGWDRAGVNWGQMLNTTGANYQPHMGLQLAKDRNYPIMLLPWGISGSKINGDWRPGDTNYNSMIADIPASGVDTVLAMHCQVGVNSIQSNDLVSAAQYKTAIGSMVAGLQADVAGPPLVLASILSDRGSGTIPDPTWYASYGTPYHKIVQGLLDAYADGTVLRGGNLTGPTNPTTAYADGTHPDTADQGQANAYSVFAAVKNVCYGGTARSPLQASVTIDSTKKIIRITFDVHLSSSLLSSVAGFRVMDNGTPVTITSQVVTSARVVTITLPDAIVGTCTVSFADLDDACGQTLPGVALALPDTTQGVSSITIPPEPFFASAVTDYVPPSGGRFSSVFAGVVR